MPTDFIQVGQYVINPAFIRSALVPSDPEGAVDLVVDLPFAYPFPGRSGEDVDAVDVTNVRRFEGPDAATLREFFARSAWAAPDWPAGTKPERPPASPTDPANPSPTPTPNTSLISNSDPNPIAHP